MNRDKYHHPLRYMKLGGDLKNCANMAQNSPFSCGRQTRASHLKKTGQSSPDLGYKTVIYHGILPSLMIRNEGKHGR